MGIDTTVLKAKMIGLRGEARETNVRNYFKDMDLAVSEMSRVLRPGKCCVIVIGSNERQTGGIRHEVEIKRMAKDHNLSLFKEITRPITGISNVMRDEYVLFFRKSRKVNF